MAINYEHLSDQDRLFLKILLDRRTPKAQIAKILKVHRSTIYREIKRNSTRYRFEPQKYHHYIHFHAQAYYLERRKRRSKIHADSKLMDYVNDKLSKGWSPWQIEGRLKAKNNGKCILSHESIYRYIYSDSRTRNCFYQKLRRKHFNREKRNSGKHRIPKELSIHCRPDIINTRNEFGHWECDLMMFARGIKSNLITLRERTSRYVIAIKNENKEARITALALISTITNIKNKVKSITFDQGSEFMRYPWIKSCLEADIYFCDPGAPEQKGAVENVNGVIRVELPRSYNIDTLKQKNIKQLTDEINDRPLKCLNYDTPKELFLKYARSNP